MRESTLWMWHVAAGAAVLVLLGVHMLIMHFDSILAALGILGGEDVLSTSSVFQRSQDVGYLILYILLLGFALYHGLYGLKNILFELTLPSQVEKLISIVLVAGGLFLFFYGTYAALVVFNMTVS